MRFAILKTIKVGSNTNRARHQDQQKMLQDYLGLVKRLKIHVPSRKCIAWTERAQFYRKVCNVKSTQVHHVLSQCFIDSEASLQTSKVNGCMNFSSQHPSGSLASSKLEISHQPTPLFLHFCTKVVQQLLRARIASLGFSSPNNLP